MGSRSAATKVIIENMSYYVMSAGLATHGNSISSKSNILQKINQGYGVENICHPGYIETDILIMGNSWLKDVGANQSHSRHRRHA